MEYPPFWRVFIAPSVYKPEVFYFHINDIIIDSVQNEIYHGICR